MKLAWIVVCALCVTACYGSRDERSVPEGELERDTDAGREPEIRGDFPVCGNGIVEAEEACDDGDAIDGNGCNNDCVESGAERWTRVLGVIGPDRVYDVASDLEGRLFVTGDVGGEAWLALFDGAGRELWQREPLGEAIGGSSGNAIAVDALGNYVLLLIELSGGALVTRLTRFQVGGGSWTRTVARIENGMGPHGDVAMDTAGNTVVAVSTYASALHWDRSLSKYDSEGNEIWSREIPFGEAIECAVATDPDDNVLVTSNDGRRIWVAKYGPEGAPIWADTTLQGGTGTGIAADADGNVFAVGTWATLESEHVWVRKYDAEGTELWTRTYDGPAGGDDHGLDVAVDFAGNVIVVGDVENEVGDPDAWVRKYDSGGTELWTRGYDGTGGGPDHALAVTTDPDGNVFAAGETRTGPVEHQDCWIRKYAP